MKKFILATLVAAGFGLTGIAQNPATTNCATPDCKNTQCAPANCNTVCNGQPCANVRECPAFAGIELTEQQQTAINNLRNECRQQTRQNREARTCQNNDNRRDFLSRVKTILTPEQYIQFLENHFLNNNRRGQGAGFRNGRVAAGRHQRQGQTCQTTPACVTQPATPAQ